MAKSRLVGSYPVIGIRPTIDGRRGALDVRGSLEEQTMNMAKSAAKLFEENLKSPLVVMNNISTQMAIMAGELIQKEEKLEDIVRILEEENETEYKIIYPQIQKQKTILTCCITGTGTAEQIRLLIENRIPKEMDIQVIS